MKDSSLNTQLDCDGFAVIPQVFDTTEVAAIITDLTTALSLSGKDDSSIRTGIGGAYAARNVLSLFPEVAELWRKPVIVKLLQNILGKDFGLVRVLFFDKPPERSWSLPWHKDKTIAIAEPVCGGNSGFKIHRKVGVPHIEPPTKVLNRMLTLRLHLDDVTTENGPLRVVAGSHRSGKTWTLDEGAQLAILANRGDVLAIRPLVTHCSGRSEDGTQRHRRILHFEFSAKQELPAGFRFHDFITC